MGIKSNEKQSSVHHETFRPESMNGGDGGGRGGGGGEGGGGGGGGVH